MTTEAWNNWNSKQDDINFKTNARTHVLINQLRIYHRDNRYRETQSKHYKQLVTNLNEIGPELKNKILLSSLI